MNHKEYTALVVEQLSASANPQRAIEMKAYLRHQFEFLGIQTPIRRELSKNLPKLPKDPEMILQIAKSLWRKPEREYRYVACDLLSQHANILSIEHLPAIKKLLQTDSWWETVDSLSSAISDIVLKEKRSDQPSQSVMDGWVLDSDFWVRRSAMIHQLGWKTNTDTDRLSCYALQLANESEFFIRKAIGWAFRDYAKCNPEFVARFMKKNGAVFSNLSVREATKNLSITHQN